MERAETLFRRYELFVAAAAVAAHAAAPEDGFRQRDVRFLLELFVNWIEQTVPGRMLPVKNTQVMRYLEELVAEGFAKKVSRVRQPQYRLTRLGLLEMLTRMADRNNRSRPEHFFCLYYFLYNYRPRIAELIKSEGKLFPPALKIEIEALLDYRELLREEIADTEKELRKLTVRVDEGIKASRLAERLFREGRALTEVVQQVEAQFPYELNSQKPLSELFSELPPDIGKWELVEGALRRSGQIWEPSRTMLNGYLQALKRMEK